MIKEILKNKWFMFIWSLFPTILFGLFVVIMFIQRVDDWGWNFPNSSAYIWATIISLFLFAIFSFISSLFLFNALNLKLSVKLEKNKGE